MRGLQSDLHGEVDVVLINIHDHVGAAVLDRFDFIASPLYLIFDSEGHEVMRLNTVPSLDTIRAVAS